jgi:hypothetical protein
MAVKHTISEMLARFGDEEAVERRRDLLSLVGFVMGAIVTLVVLTIIVVYVLGGLLGAALYGVGLVDRLMTLGPSKLACCLALA